MKTKSHFLEKLLVAGVVVLATLPFAHAVPSLRITDGVDTVTIADSGSGDLNPFEGAVTFIGSLGNFYLNVSTGISKPLLGSAERPFLELSSVDVSGLPGTLTILFSDTSFTPIDGALAASIGGVSWGGNIVYSTYADASNALFGTSLLLTSQSYEGAFSGTNFSSLAVGPTFSLTQKLVINHPGWFLTSSFDAELKAVPDGGSTVSLLGAVLVGLEGLRRRFRGAIKIA
jgi:hypothetical protein